MPERFDAVVIGAGFYGLSVALHLRRRGLRSVCVLEAGETTMGRASFGNQARVHNGYHYPRSVLTGLRSRLNLPRFRADFGEAVVGDFAHYYAVASMLSKTNARQFEAFCRRIGARLTPAPADVRAAFDGGRVEQVFRVEEPAFDASVLRSVLGERIEAVGGIDVRLRTTADRIVGADGLVEVVAGARSFVAPTVISAVYAGINELHHASGLPEIDVQHEVTEMAVVTLPDRLHGAAFTVMDGPFFSLMPFPALGAHTLSHVRFTPRVRWREHVGGPVRATAPALAAARSGSSYRGMEADVLRYLPAARGMRRSDSLYEVKTVLTRSADDDSRPILYRRDHGIRGYACVLGGKLDNIYDVLDEMDRHDR